MHSFRAMLHFTTNSFAEDANLKEYGVLIHSRAGEDDNLYSGEVQPSNPDQTIP